MDDKGFRRLEHANADENFKNHSPSRRSCTAAQFCYNTAIKHEIDSQPPMNFLGFLTPACPPSCPFEARRAKPEAWHAKGGHLKPLCRQQRLVFEGLTEFGHDFGYG